MKSKQVFVFFKVIPIFTITSKFSKIKCFIHSCDFCRLSKQVYYYELSKEDYKTRYKHASDFSLAIKNYKSSTGCRIDHLHLKERPVMIMSLHIKSTISCQQNSQSSKTLMKYLMKTNIRIYPPNKNVFSSKIANSTLWTSIGTMQKWEHFEK